MEKRWVVLICLFFSPLLPKPVFRKPPKEHSSQIKSVKNSTLNPAYKSSIESKDDGAESDANAKTTEALVKELQQQITELKSTVSLKL